MCFVVVFCFNLYPKGGCFCSKYTHDAHPKSVVAGLDLCEMQTVNSRGTEGTEREGPALFQHTTCVMVLPAATGLNLASSCWIGLGSCWKGGQPLVVHLWNKGDASLE